MRTHNNLPSVCKHCRHYSPQGRRGGMCQKLNAPVRGDWQACSLVNSPFMPTWETWEEIAFAEEPKLTPIEAITKHHSPSEIEIQLDIEAETESETVLTA